MTGGTPSRGSRSGTGTGSSSTVSLTPQTLVPNAGTAYFCELSDDAGPHGHGHHLGTVSGAELAGNASEVALDGQRGQSQRLADLLVGAAVGYEVQNLDLATGELGNAVLLGAAAQASGQQGCHRRVGV